MGFFDLSCVFFFFQILVALVEWLSSQVTIKILVLLVRSRLVRLRWVWGSSVMSKNSVRVGSTACAGRLNSLQERKPAIYSILFRQHTNILESTERAPRFPGQRWIYATRSPQTWPRTLQARGLLLTTSPQIRQTQT